MMQATESRDHVKAQCRRVSFARVGAAALSLGWQVVAVGDFSKLPSRLEIPGMFVMFRMRFDLGFFCPLTELDGNEKQ